MTKIKDLIRDCKTAIDENDQERLSKYLQKIEDIQKDDLHFQGEYLPSLIEYAAINEKDIAFKVMMSKCRNFIAYDMLEALYTVCERNRLDLVDFFLDRCDTYAPKETAHDIKTEALLKYALELDNVGILKKATANGANVKATHYNGVSKVLMLAIEQKAIKCLPVLLKSGAPLEIDYYRFFYLVPNMDMQKQIKTVHTLLEHGLVLSFRDLNGYASMYGGHQRRRMHYQVEDLIIQWEKRKRIERFPVSFKDTCKMADLRKIYNQASMHSKSPTTPIMALAKAGRFSEVLDVARRTKMPLTLEDFWQKDADKNRVIDFLGAQKQIHLINDPSLWVGRFDVYQKLYNSVPPVYQKQFDFEKIKEGQEPQVRKIKKTHKHRALKRRR